MAGKKIVDVILSAASSLIEAIKSFIKFIGYIGKMKPNTEKT